MKALLRASAAGLLLILPGVSLASQVQFNSCGSQCTLYFDPNGFGASELPSPCFYRSYNCRIGSMPSMPDIVITNTVHITNASNGNKGTGGSSTGTTGTTGDTGTTGTTGTTGDSGANLDVGTNDSTGTTGDPGGNNGNPDPVGNPVITPSDGSGGGDGAVAASVPLPASAEMAGAGVAATMLFSWLRSRRQARA